MTKTMSFLTSAATALVLATSSHAADSELTVLDWAGWEFDGILTDYVAKHGDKPTYAFFGDDDEAGGVFVEAVDDAYAVRTACVSGRPVR